MPAGGANEGWMDAWVDERREEACIPLTAMMECRLDPPLMCQDGSSHLSFLSYFLLLPLPSLSLSLSPISPDFNLLFLSPDLSPFFLYSTQQSLHPSLLFHHVPSFLSLTLDPLNGSHWFLVMSQNNMSGNWQEAHPLTFCVFSLIYSLASSVLTCTHWLVSLNAETHLFVF